MPDFQPHPPGRRYRPDIDGLRALAILPVVFFHYQVPGFSGGFVGVDVFFVISGYLIASLIHAEMREGRFSILGFYERRVRRIFPALFTVLVASTLAAIVILFPDDLERFGRSLFATAFFAANFEFWRELGYFDVSAELKPLLHLWSIAVEEQFYLLFPPILMAVAGRAKARGLATVAVIFAASLAFSLWAVRTHPEFAFYMLPARAWELMLGAMLAIGSLEPPPRAVREGMAALGVAMIAASVALYTRATPFPGAAALLPCVGTALVIHAGHGETSVNAALSWRPLVFVGLISYSLYLWHWPLIVYARHVLGHEPGAWATAGLMAAAFALAAFSWRFVERPFRARTFRPPRRKLFAGALAAMAAAAACGAVFVSARGLPGRLPADVQRILAAEHDEDPRAVTCFGMTGADVRAGKLCRIGDLSAPVPDFVLWGDSHAGSIIPAVDVVAKREHRSGYFAATDSCPPLLGVTRPDAWKCRDFNDAVIDVALGPHIRDVILDARWAKNAEGLSYGDEPPGRILLYDDLGRGTDRASTHAVFLRGLVRTVGKLTDAKKKVIIVASAPEIGWPVPVVLARLRLMGDKRDMDLPLETDLRRQRTVLLDFGLMKFRFGVRLVDPADVLCDDRVCHVIENGYPLYRDEHHLSAHAARLLIPELSKVF
ncbi:MAG TPA: acyltransferase family protein [Rhizomicrobium sp.]|nr:acyltransferase family protein [Rhizomicrobium sp.]